MVELGPHLFSTPAFWLAVIFLAPIMALLLDFGLSATARQAAPLDRQIFQVCTFFVEVVYEAVCFVGSTGSADTLHSGFDAANARKLLTGTGTSA